VGISIFQLEVSPHLRILLLPQPIVVVHELVAANISCLCDLLYSWWGRDRSISRIGKRADQEKERRNLTETRTSMHKMEAPKTCSLETRKYKSRHNHQNHVISHNAVQLDVAKVFGRRPLRST